MGAEQFDQISVGATANDAFETAVSQAQYDWGHAGYTGTIAEKIEFVFFSLPKGMLFRDFESSYSRYQNRGYERSSGLAVEDGPYDDFFADVLKKTDDKWGPAGCLMIPDDEAQSMGIDLPEGVVHAYYFFGWASS